MHLETVLESNDIETEHEVCSGGFDKWHGYRLPRQLVLVQIGLSER